MPIWLLKTRIEHVMSFIKIWKYYQSSKNLSDEELKDRIRKLRGEGKRETLKQVSANHLGCNVMILKVTIKVKMYVKANAQVALAFLYAETEKNMDNTIIKSEMVEKTGVFSKDMSKRYELTIKIQAKKEKSILVLCLNPASDNLQVVDTTTNYLMNNLFSMGYTTITICNLFASICPKLIASSLGDNSDNKNYIREVVERDFQNILIGYGNTFANNKKIIAKKAEIEKMLISKGRKVVELVDESELYSRLKTIHPLFAGQRFSGKWKFRKHVFLEETEKEQESKCI